MSMIMKDRDDMRKQIGYMNKEVQILRKIKRNVRNQKRKQNAFNGHIGRLEMAKE